MRDTGTLLSIAPSPVFKELFCPPSLSPALPKLCPGTLPGGPLQGEFPNELQGQHFHFKAPSWLNTHRHPLPAPSSPLHLPTPALRNANVANPILC